jgi:hypothetical protein
MRFSKWSLLALVIFAIPIAGSLGRMGSPERRIPAGYAQGKSAELKSRALRDADVLARTAAELRRLVDSQWKARHAHELSESRRIFDYRSAPWPAPDGNDFYRNQYGLAYRQQMAWNTQRIIARNQEEISRIINDTYWNRQRSLDRINRRFSDYMRGPTSSWGREGHRGGGRREE